MEWIPRKLGMIERGQIVDYDQGKGRLRLGGYGEPKGEEMIDKKDFSNSTCGYGIQISLLHECITNHATLMSLHERNSMFFKKVFEDHLEDLRFNVDSVAMMPVPNNIRIEKILAGLDCYRVRSILSKDLYDDFIVPIIKKLEKALADRRRK